MTGVEQAGDVGDALQCSDRNCRLDTFLIGEDQVLAIGCELGDRFVEVELNVVFVHERSDQVSTAKHVDHLGHRLKGSDVEVGLGAVLTSKGERPVRVRRKCRHRLKQIKLDFILIDEGADEIACIQQINDLGSRLKLSNRNCCLDALLVGEDQVLAVSLEHCHGLEELELVAIFGNVRTDQVATAKKVGDLGDGL